MTIKNLQISDEMYDVKKPKLDKETSLVLTGYPQIDKPWKKYYSKEALESEIPKRTLYENLKMVCLERNNAIAINYFGKKITYKELLKRIDDVAQAFSNLGVNDEDVVTLMLPNTPENVISLYALNKIGAIANYVDLRTSDEELISYLKDSDSKIVLATDLFLDNLIKVIDKTDVKHIVVGSPSDSLPLGIKQIYRLKNKKSQTTDKCIFWKDFEKSCKIHSDEYKPYIPNKEACITYTSGTTGKPKGVVLTNENFISQVYQYKDSGLEFKNTDTFFSQVPPFLAFNCVMATNLPLSLGLCVVMHPNYEPDKFAENMIKTKANHSIAGPADWSNFLENPKVRQTDLSFMKTLASGASHLDATRKKQIDDLLQKQGCDNLVIEGYGLSEASTAVCTNLPQINVENSVGIPLPKTNICVWDNENGQFLPYGQEGELCFCGPTIMKEYFKNEEATAEALKVHDDNVWLHTGDLGYVTEEGIVHVTGRLKRVIVSHDGFKISPLEIENVIMTCPDVHDCCVVGIFDSIHDFGQIPVANIVVEKNISKTDDEVIEEIKELCNNKIIDIHLPKKYVLVNEIPLTKVGKVDYRKLTEELEEKQKILKK